MKPSGSGTARPPGIRPVHRFRPVLLGALGIAWVLALVGTPGGTQSEREVLVVDFSRSVHPGWERILEAAVDEAAADSGSGGARRRTLVGFASDARILGSAPGEGEPGDLRVAASAVLRDLPPAWREGSDLLAGIRQALAAAGPSGSGRIALRVLGDLRHRPGEIDEAFRLARAAGAALAFRFLDPLPRPADLRLALDGPAPALRPGRPSIVRLRLDAVAAGRRTVTLAAGGVSVATTIDPATGSLGLAIPVAPPADAREIEVRIADSGGEDADPANDRLTIPVVAEGRRRVHVCGSLAAPVSGLFAGAGIELTSGDVLPGDPEAYDAVVLADLSLGAATDGSAEPVARLVRAVEGSGTGLLATGGPHAFRGGGYAGSALDALLPLSSRLPEGRDIRILLDRSGSMDEDDRLGRAVEAVLSLARGLGPEDRLQIVPFAAAPDPAIPEAPAAPEDVLASADRLWRLRPGGGTDVVSALAAARFEGSAAKERILAVLSDLRDEKLDAAGVAGRLRSTWERERVSVSVLLLDGDEATRARVAALGARLCPVDRITPEVFLRTLEPQAWKTGELEVRWREGPDAGRPAGDLRAWNPTIPGREARVLLEGSGGEPVAAEARRGAGRVIAFASDPTLEGWCRELVSAFLPRVFGASRGEFTARADGGTLSISGAADRVRAGRLALVSGSAAFPMNEVGAGRWIAGGWPDERHPWRIRDEATGEVLAGLAPPAAGDPEFRLPAAATPDPEPGAPERRGSGPRTRWPFELVTAVFLALIACAGGATSRRHT